MLAYHYREALSLAAAAGVDASALHEPARHAFAEGARRAYYLGAAEAAFALAHEALALTPEDAPERPSVQLLAAYAGRLVGGEAVQGLLEAALEGFVARDDLGHAAEAAGVLASHFFYLGDLERQREARDRSLELARQAPPSAATARAIAHAARATEVIDGEFARAIELAQEALALAEEAGEDETAAICLNTIGMARVHEGDPAGFDDLEQSVEMAERAGSVFHLHGGLNNLANLLWYAGRLEEGSRRIHEARALCERYGFEYARKWNDAELVYNAFFLGDLEAVLDSSSRFLADLVPGSAYQQRALLATRARALLACGQVEEAVAGAEEAFASTRESGADAQVGPYVLVALTRALRAAGRETEAEARLAEVLATDTGEEVYDLVLHLVELGRGERYLARTEEKPGHLWQEAGRAAASGDLAGAAELYGRMGARYAEAWAALLAAENGDTSRLDSALAYFEEQRAAPYVQRCRALMQASA